MQTTTLPAGTIAQYRKVGRVEIIGHAGDWYPKYDTHRDAWAQPYRVRFLTGPRKYRERTDSLVWLAHRDVVEG